MSSKERSKGKSTEKSKEKKAGSKKASASAAAASENAFLATAAIIDSSLAGISSAYNNINEANLNALLSSHYDDPDASFVPAGSASAAVPAPRSKSLKKSVTSLEHASAAVASSSAAAVRSPSPKAFAKVVETLDETSKVIARVKAEAAAAADAALVTAVKAKLERDTGLGALIIGHLSEVPPMLRCHEIKAFLGFLWRLESRIKLRARERLHPYIFDGEKSLDCRTATERDFATYLVDIIGVAPKAGEPARGILFRTDIFNEGTIPGLPFSSSEALNYFFSEQWAAFLKTPAAYKKKKGGSRKRRRRLNRTRKI